MMTRTILHHRRVFARTLGARTLGTLALGALALGALAMAGCDRAGAAAERPVTQSPAPPNPPQAGGAPAGTRLFMDVHELGPGNVTAAAVAEAHAKDLAVQAKHGVRFLRYWVDEEQGKVYCLSDAPHADAIRSAHREAHGLVPHHVGPVTEGE